MGVVGPGLKEFEEGMREDHVGEGLSQRRLKKAIDDQLMIQNKEALVRNSPSQLT